MRNGMEREIESRKRALFGTTMKSQQENPAVRFAPADIFVAPSNTTVQFG
jgi:hypothetical protein